ncbi:hypothetical protein BJY52DRAFT_884098 [Lactarius psammicola]|nr:hypothetical protein BJY52DRAFT_884098 [Lactarius psammicola]
MKNKPDPYLNAEVDRFRRRCSRWATRISSTFGPCRVCVGGAIIDHRSSHLTKPRSLDLSAFDAKQLINGRNHTTQTKRNKNKTRADHTRIVTAQIRADPLGQCLLLRPFALGFCGVPSTKTIGLFACVWVVVELFSAAAIVVVGSASTLTGGAFDPLRRRPLNTLDMLTSRCSTLRVLGSARRMSASCSKEAERERERDGTKLRVDLWFGACDSGRTVCGSCPSESPSSSSDDVHWGIRKSFLRRSLYCSGSF